MNKFNVQGKAKQVSASVLNPLNAGLRFIINVCAQSGKYDSPLDTLLSKRWVKVREDYKGWYATQHNFKPGLLNTTAVSSDTWVVNMLVKDKDNNVSDVALKTAAKKLSDLSKYEHASVHVSNLLVKEMPELMDLLKTHLLDEGVNVYFYEEPVK